MPRTPSHHGGRLAVPTTLMRLAALSAVMAASMTASARAAAPLYSTASPFNQPIAAAPAIDPESSQMVGSLVEARNLKGFPIAVREWTIPAYEATATTPRYDVPITGRPPGWRWDGAWTPTYNTMMSVPIPDEAKPDSADDGHMSVLDPASGCEYDFYAATDNLTPTILRPNGDITNTWTKTGATTAWQALDENVSSPTAATTVDYIQSAAVAGRVAEVALKNPAAGTKSTAGKAWFYAGTAATRLKVDAVSQGTVRATTTLTAGKALGWYSLAVPTTTQASLDDLRLRFTALDAAVASVRAAYYAPTPLKSWSASWGNTIRMDGDGVYGDGTSTRASGFGLAGMIWPEELRAGSIDHALVFAYPYTKAGGPVAPATAADGLSTRLDAIPFGARVQLDPSLNLDALGLTAYEKTVAKALQRYGMILGDSGGALSLYAINAKSYAVDPYAGVLPADDYAYLSKLPVDRFRVLATGAQNTRTAPPMDAPRCGLFR